MEAALGGPLASLPFVGSSHNQNSAWGEGFRVARSQGNGGQPKSMPGDWPAALSKARGTGG
jgi:hypothetical protein